MLRDTGMTGLGFMVEVINVCGDGIRKCRMKNKYSIISLLLSANLIISLSNETSANDDGVQADVQWVVPHPPCGLLSWQQ
jgi:hypothetical protein